MNPTSLNRAAFRLAAALAVVFSVATAVGCADLADPAALEAHPDGWMLEASTSFHGKAVVESAFKSNSCATCHGQDYAGGTSGVSCSTAGCHQGYPHPEGDFLDPQSASFHGRTVLASASKSLICATCHGADFAGGSVGQGCYGSGCHDTYPHGPVFGGPTAAVSHPAYLRDTTHWDLAGCVTCHGGSYDGEGTAEKNCRTCHAQAGGPEACDTCHGQGETGAPPPDLYGNEETTLRSVGAHAAHAALAAGFASCANCHVVPASYGSAGHLDGASRPQAEIVFGSVAVHGGAEPSFSVGAASCGNTWCHGNFSFPKAASSNQWIYSGDTIAGTPVTVTWTSVGTGQASCGSCHGLPPDGHLSFPDLRCGFCHPSASTEADVISDPTLHSNGQVDVY